MKIKDLIEKYKTDENFRNKVGLYWATVTNFGVAIVQLYGGIRYQSVWFTAFAVYYAVLAVVKFYLARSVGKKEKAAWAAFQVVGGVMSFLNIALVVMIVIMIADPSVAIRPYSTVIAGITGVWTLGSAGIAIYNLFRVRQKNNPVALADRLVQLITAIVSVLLLQTSIIASVTPTEVDMVLDKVSEIEAVTRAPEEMAMAFNEVFRGLATSNTITGVIVGVLAWGVTGYMVIRGPIEKRRN